MRVLADENIPFVRQAFAQFGPVRTVNGRGLNHVDCRDAEVLLVRSVTRVNAELLNNTPVRFVGTATIGEDHIDTDWLQSQDIAFASAPGSNAESAAEYVVGALLAAGEQRGHGLAGLRVGIVGCGNVGGRVRAKLSALGMECRIYDPPRAARGVADEYASLADVLASDIVTLHVPLVADGEHPTRDLANADFFAAMKPDAIFLNTARGPVVDESALHAKLDAAPDFHAILDTWRGEPRIDARLLQRAALATPHIAGYSQDGKTNGTQMLYQALCAFTGQEPRWSAQAQLPPPAVTSLTLSPGVSVEQAVSLAARACYDPRRDDAALRRYPRQADPAAYFDGLRKNYPKRREYAQLRVEAPAGPVAETLRALGFRG